MAQIKVMAGQKFFDLKSGKEFTASAAQDVGGGKMGQFINAAGFSLSAPQAQAQAPTAPPAPTIQQPIIQPKPTNKPGQLTPGKLVKFQDGSDIFAVGGTEAIPTLSKVQSQKTIQNAGLFGNIETVDPSMKNRYELEMVGNQGGYRWKPIPLVQMSPMAGSADLNAFLGIQGSGPAAQADPNELIWVQKGPNQLQLKRSVADQWVEAGTATYLNPEDSEKAVIVSGLTQGMDTTTERGRQIVDLVSDAGNDALADKKFVQDVFQEFHGRMPDANDYKEFVGKGIQDVFNVVKGGAPNGAASGSTQTTTGTTVDSGDVGQYESPSTVAPAVPSDNAILNQLQSTADTWLEGINKDIFNMQQTLLQKTQSDIAAAEAREATFEGKVTAAADMDPEKYFQDKLDELKWKENFDKIEELKLEMENTRTSMNLGVTQEQQRGGPMSLGTRRQKEVEQRGAITLAGYAAQAAVYSGQLDRARQIALDGVGLYKDYIAQQVNVYSSLLTFEKNDIIRLEKDEKEYVTSQINMLEAKSKQMDADKDAIIKLMTDEDTAKIAVDAGISLDDTIEEAAAKYSKELANQPWDGEVKNFGTSAKPAWGQKQEDGSWEPFSVNETPTAPTSSEFEEGDFGGWCGSYLQKIMEGVPLVGNSIQTKMAIMNVTKDELVNDVQVDDVLVIDVGEYGHVARVAAVNGDGTVTLEESNWSSNNSKLVGKSRKVDITADNIKGAYRGGSLKGGTPEPDTEEVVFTDEEAEFFKVLNKARTRLARTLAGVATGSEKTTWGAEWNLLKQAYNPSNEELDAMLDKDKYFTLN